MDILSVHFQTKSRPDPLSVKSSLVLQDTDVDSKGKIKKIYI